MRKSEKYLAGIGFWIGSGVFSIINIFKILTHANILNYDYIMTGIALIFILLSLILQKKTNKGDNWKLKFKFGLGFWMGGGTYSLINMITSVPLKLGRIKN